MGRLLRYVGVFLLALAACLLVVDTAGWLPHDAVDAWLWGAARIGVLCLGAGILLALLSPLGRELRRGRCVRCGAHIERSQSYCADHLQEAVNEYRDRTREGM